MPPQVKGGADRLLPRFFISNCQAHDLPGKATALQSFREQARSRLGFG